MNKTSTTRRTHWNGSPLFLAALAIVLVACGGGDGVPETPRVAEEPERVSEVAETREISSRLIMPSKRAPKLEARSAATDDAPAPTVEAPAPPAPPDEYAGWKTYRHTNGSKFRYPADWRVDETAMGLVLSPPDLDRDRELIAVFASSAGGITDPMSDEVARTIDKLIVQSFPGFRRKGEPRVVETRAGAGASHDFSGRTADGRRAKCRVFLLIKDDFAVNFTVLTTSIAFRKRTAVVEKIFASLSAGDGQETAPRTATARAQVATDSDPQLVGVFSGESIASGNGVYINTQLVYALNADGTVLYGARSHMNASRRDTAGNLRWAANGQTGGNVDKGRWSAKGGFISFVWDDGTSGRVAYGFEPDGTLVLRNAATRELINMYTRVQ